MNEYSLIYPDGNVEDVYVDANFCVGETIGMIGSKGYVIEKIWHYLDKKRLDSNLKPSVKTMIKLRANFTQNDQTL